MLALRLTGSCSPPSMDLMVRPLEEERILKFYEDWKNDPRSATLVQAAVS